MKNKLTNTKSILKMLKKNYGCKGPWAVEQARKMKKINDEFHEALKNIRKSIND